MVTRTVQRRGALHPLLRLRWLRAHDPGPPEPIDGEGAALGHLESRPVAQPVRFGQGIRLHGAAFHPPQQPREDGPGKGRRPPGEIFDHQLPVGREQPAQSG